jgi:hypothetical protein
VTVFASGRVRPELSSHEAVDELDVLPEAGSKRPAPDGVRLAGEWSASFPADNRVRYEPVHEDTTREG